MDHKQYLSANKKLKKESYIINEKLGVWKLGVWYSNNHHDSTFTTSGITRGKGVTYYQGRIDDSFQFNTPESCVLEEGDWFEIDQGITYTDFVDGVIPKEMMDNHEIEDIVWTMHTELAHQYPDLQMIMEDYSLKFDEKKRMFVCILCNKKVDAELERSCSKECDMVTLQFIRQEKVE